MLMRRGQALAVVAVLGSLLLLLRDVTCGYQPQYERDVQIMFGDGAYRYPDRDDVATNPNYFISELNFDLIENTVVMGAANQLLFLSTADLSPLHVYEWPATAENLDLCRNPESKGMAGSVSTLENPDYICNNHIRVYRRLPSNSSLVLVCGTQAVIDPQCRILEVTVSEDGVSVNDHSPVSASDGLISYFPQFSQFGEFRGSDDSDPVYLSAGFFTGGNTGVARHFSISYQNITLTTPSDPNTLETTELFRTINANNNWLRFPVTFVGSHRADYSPTAPAGRNSDYQFWFLLLRENLVTDEVIYSRLVRICRNDPGSQLTSGGAKYFTTFMKARIFCERKKPSSLEFTATLDYIYNSITSFVFSEGRYYGNDSPQRLLYGSFTGPNNGPVGSALCVYPADNSLEDAPQSTGRSGSVFDIFRDDISETSDGTSPVENAFVECAAEGRQEQDQQLLFSTKSVDQIGDDPILVLDDVIVTQMVQDSVCVVTSDDPSTCVDQDVLFLGLDSGRVLKVVFRTDDNGDSDPVVVENIELDPDDVRNVTAMELRKISNEKFLFVATETRVYKLPLQRCSDFSCCNCSECVASRDPYCVYNYESHLCEENTLTSSEPVHSRYHQDIHRGMVEESCDCPVVTLRPINPVVHESEGSVTFNISATREVSIEFQTIRGSADARDFTVMSQTVHLSLEASVTVPITDDTAFEPEQQFSVSLSADVGVVFINDLTTVTILDDDGDEGVSFQVKFLTGVDCKDTVAIDDHFVSQLREALVSGVHDNCQESCDDFTSDNIIKPQLLTTCDGMWSVALEGEMLSTENAPVSTSLLPALSKWVSQNSTVTVDQLTLTANCIDSTPETKSALDMYCVPPTSGVLPSKDDNYLSAFVALLVLFIITVAIAGVLSIIVIVLLRNRHKPSSKIFCMGSPESKSSTWKAGVPIDCIDGYYTTPGEELQTTAPPTEKLQTTAPPTAELQTTAPPTEKLQTTAPPTAVSQTRANPPLRHQPVSYVAAQDHSVLPMAPPSSGETALSTLHEDQGETHPGSGDCEMSGNTAYGMRNGVNGDGVRSEGVQPVDYEIPPNTAYGIKHGVNGEGVMGVGGTVVPLH